MSSCCDPNAPKVLMLAVGDQLVGLVGVEQAFLDVGNLDLANEKLGEKLLEIVSRRNYIPNGAEVEYMVALQRAYNSYLAAR